MSFKKLSACVIATAALLGGCASIVSDSQYPVAFQSDPVGARFTVTNKKGAIIYDGSTPATVMLESGAGYFQSGDYTVTFAKDGHATNTVQVNATLDGWYIGNLLTGPIGFLVIDPLTGAMWKLPPVVSTRLQKLQSADAQQSPEKKQGLQVVSLNQVPEDLRADMIALTP